MYGTHIVGHKEGWCHTNGMKYGNQVFDTAVLFNSHDVLSSLTFMYLLYNKPMQCSDSERNKEMNAAAAR
jgi:hypothetical protein